MPGNITDSDTFSDPIVHPTDGDAVNGAGIELVAQGLANRTRWLLNRILGATAQTIIVPPIPAAQEGEYFATASMPADTTDGAMLQSGVPGSDPICKCFLVGLPRTGTITGVRANVFGAWASAVHGALPSSMPSIQLWKMNAQSGALAQVGSTATDTSANVAAYEVAHQLSIASISQTIEGFVFFVLVRGEDDTNALADSFAVMSFEVDVEPV